MDDVGWNVTETAARRGCERGTLSRLLNGKAGVSANMALALENIGWGTAEHWMRMQASYELAQARRARVACRTAHERMVRMIWSRVRAPERDTTVPVPLPFCGHRLRPMARGPSYGQSGAD